MRVERVRAICLLLLMAACARPAPTPHAATLAASPAICRVGPDGGPVAPSQQTSDRGIGGTGAPVKLEADRGLGGTGIIAVITGFGSVCVAGQEVAVAPNVPVSISDPVAIGGQPASAGSLRAGQVAVIDAAGAGPGLRARAIAIRFEVSGPVDSLIGDALVIAGQRVVVTTATWGGAPAVGDWVTVSGLRRADGVIEATRLDPRPPGVVLVHGRLLPGAGTERIGGLPVRPIPGTDGLIGQDVTAIGSVMAGTMLAEQVVPDLLASNPAALFQPTIGTFYVETFAAWEGGRVRFGQGFSAPGTSLAVAGHAVIALERGSFGLRAIGVVPNAGFRGAGQFGFGRALAPPGRFEPGSAPNRPAGLRGGGRGRGPGQGAPGWYRPRGPGRYDREGGPAPGRFQGRGGGFGRWRWR